MNIKGFFLVFLFLIAALVVMHPTKTHALSGSNFQAGRIIDDGIFFNPGGMSVNEIQNFLNAKVPVCDTNGLQPYAGTTRALYGASKGYPAPYICLKDYSMNTTSKPAEDKLCNGYATQSQTAAQIIYGVAQSCGINPKVLIVLLQKEQSLITDDWPWTIQYRSATGYGCPDTAPCDSQYYGFFNQVYAAARQFKNYAKNPSYYNYKANQNNYIFYNPNSQCGGSTVYITNQATAALYNYTPYQPNQAAVNNLYGSGDSCSAYGNRNFWRLFNDWFGTTLTNSYNASFFDFSGYPTLQAGTSTTVYIRYKNTGNATWRDASGPSELGQPVVLATTNPINNSSIFYDPSWKSTSRIATNFSKVYEADGTNIADDQHIARNGQIVEYQFKVSTPITMENYSQLWLQPVREGAADWGMNGIGFFNVYTTPPATRAKIIQIQPSKDISVPLGEKKTIKITFQNTGLSTFKEYRSISSGYPVTLATTSPINRSSIFYSSDWHSINRPVIKFSQVRKSSGLVSSSPYEALTGDYFDIEFTLTSPYGTYPDKYIENFELVREGDPNWSIPGSTTSISVGVRGSSQAVKFYSLSSYPSLVPLQSKEIKLRYVNAGTDNLYDASSFGGTGYFPLVLANTDPINRSSHFFDPTWHSTSRPSINFSRVLEKDGSTLAPNQHIAAPGQILEFSYLYKAPWYAQPATYREWIAPVLEGSPVWNVGGSGYIDVTVIAP